MFEQSFKFKKEELEEEVSPEKREAFFEDFDKKEAVIQKEAEGFLMSLVPEKFKKEAVGLLAAFSIFTSASSAFAEGLKGEEIDKEKLLPPEQSDIIKSEVKNKIAPFDWKKIADKIEISVGGEIRETSRFDMVEAMEDFYNKPNDWYTDFEKLSPIIVDTVKQSQNVSDFFHNIENVGAKLDDRHKVIFLSKIGEYLLETYNSDMLESGQSVEISDEKMFQGLKDVVNGGDAKTGVCSNINVFQLKVIEKMGMEAWLQIGGSKLNRKQSAHVLPGLIVENNEKKQIMYLDYGMAIPTGTLNFRDASGILEKHLRAVDVFSSFVGNEKEVLFPVESRAQEVIKNAAGIEEVGERLEGELSSGEIKKEKGLEIKLSPETKEIKLTKDSFGIAYFNFQDVNGNPYQSLEDLSAVRGSFNLKDGQFGLEANATILHMNIKDLYEEKSITQDEIIARIATDYIDSRKFTKKEYGQFALNFGTTLQGVLRLPVGEDIPSWRTEGAFGARLIYVNPSETGKFYIGTSEAFRGQYKDYLYQDLVIKEVAKILTVGAEIKVNEAQILNLEAVRSELDWGKKMEIKGGLSGREWKGELGYEKATSEYERFVPSSEKVSAEVGYKGGPKWEIDVLGSKTIEKYAGAKSEDSYGAEVKLKIFLW